MKSTLAEIRSAGLDCGIAISPDTPVEVLDDYLEDIDMALVMSVYPGFGGQSFIPATYDRIRSLRNKLNDRGLDINIEVDGGVSGINIKDVLDAGANVIVAGSAVFNGDIDKNVSELLEALK